VIQEFTTTDQPRASLLQWLQVGHRVRQTDPDNLSYPTSHNRADLEAASGWRGAPEFALSTC